MKAHSLLKSTCDTLRESVDSVWNLSLKSLSLEKTLNYSVGQTWDCGSVRSVNLAFRNLYVLDIFQDRLPAYSPAWVVKVAVEIHELFFQYFP